MVDRSWEGSRTDFVEVTVTEEMVKNLAEALNDKTAIFYSSEEAKMEGFSNIPAPITMPFLFWKFVHVPWLNNVGPLIHGEQAFSYQEPIFAGKTYRCSVYLKKVLIKGNKQFLYHDLDVFDGERKIAECSSTFILLLREGDQP
jgi:hypothetical protein